MRIGGMSEAEYTGLVRPVSDTSRGAQNPPSSAAERFARAAWTTIAEPGDRDAGRLAAALGPVEALRVLLDGIDGDGLSSLAADAGLDADPDGWTDALKRWQPRAGLSNTVRALTQAERFGMSLLIPGDAAWPAQLDDLQEFAPHAMWARGDIARLAQLERSIALVGARAATGYGEHVTVESASGLVDRGFAIVSGAAYGIDGTAHRAALASRGLTVAVLAGGLDRVYPSGHEQLVARIIDRGVALSEVPPGTSPTKWRFLQRNRLIAALASATVVIEAGWRSGSLNTANHAGTLGRPLGAVPGPVTSAASAGCHKLLRESAAVCVTTADEMAELAGPFALASESRGHPDEPAEPSSNRVRVLDALSERSARRIERVAELSGLATDRVRAELGLLELDGSVLERPSGWVRRRSG